MDIVLVIMLVCGLPDTVLIKMKDKPAQYTHNVSSPEIASKIKALLAQNPTVIVYEDERGICA